MWLSLMDPKDVWPLCTAILGFLLMLSEYLPFSSCEFNGVAQYLIFRWKKPPVSDDPLSNLLPITAPPQLIEVAK